MSTLLSGLDEATCREILGTEPWAQASVRWCAPGEFLEATVDKAGYRMVWLYRSPWGLANTALAGSESDGLDAALDRWLSDNRAVLNMRRQFGEKLFVVNVENVSVAALHAELGGTDSGDGAGGSASPEAAVVGEEDERERIVRHLFEWMAPRHCEVFEALDAASWLPEREPDFCVEAVPGEKHLIQFLERCCKNAASTDLSPNSDQLGADNLKQESDLLLLQLHQVQEELEQYYLKNIELSKLVSGGQSNQALKLQLQLMQNELLAVHSPPAQEAVAQASGFARLIPGRVRVRLERSKASKALEAKLKTVRESEWFDGRWYLETYPDVRNAGIDPAEHFCNFGWKEGRSPSGGFDTAYYLRTNPDVAASGMNPLLHFMQHGLGEGRSPRNPA